MIKALYNTRISIKSILFLALYYFISSFVVGQSAQKQFAPMRVLVIDFENKVKKGEQILFEGLETGEVYKGVSDVEGKFKVELKGGDTYLIKIKGVGEAQDYNRITIPLLGVGQMYQEGQLTIQFESAKTFTLDNVHFASGKTILTKASYNELDELVEYMTLKEDVSIEVAGHTDDVGVDTSNMKLSQLRANAVRDYLISKKIASSRVVAKGYGESRPKDTNETPQGRQNNRRTEVVLR